MAGGTLRIESNNSSVSVSLTETASGIATQLYSDEACTVVATQPVAVPANTPALLYVVNGGTYTLSVKANGVEIAGAYGVTRQVVFDHGEFLGLRFNAPREGLPDSGTYALSGSATLSDLSAVMADEVPMAQQPTVVFTGSATTSYTSGRNYPAVVSSSANSVYRLNVSDYTVSGAFLVPNQVAATVGATPAADQSQALQVDFDVDSLSFELDLDCKSTSLSLLRVWANEQQSVTFGPPSATGRQLVKVTFATRAYRRVSVELDSNFLFYGVNVPVDGTIVAPTNQTTGKIAFIGDSYAHGAGYNSTAASLRSYVTTAARQLGFANYRRYAADGTGVVTVGAFGTYAARVAAIAAYAPDVVVVQGSQNDNGAGGIQAATTTLVQSIQAALPKAKIIVTGVLRSYAVQAADVTVNTALAAAAAATGVPFVDTTGWFTGTGSVTTPNTTGNADVYNYQYAVGHPSPAGHRYLGRQVARAIATALGRDTAARSEPAANSLLAAVGAGTAMTPRRAGGESIMSPWETTANNVTFTSGVLKLTKARVALRTETINSIAVGVGGTGASGTTTAIAGIYLVDPATGAMTLVASSANNTGLWNVNFQSPVPGGINVAAALSAPFTKVAGQTYRVGLLWAGTTSPTIYGSGADAVGDTNWVKDAGGSATFGTGLSALPATITDAAITAAASNIPNAVLLP